MNRKNKRKSSEKKIKIDKNKKKVDFEGNKNKNRRLEKNKIMNNMEEIKNEGLEGQWMICEGKYKINRNTIRYWFKK